MRTYAVSGGGAVVSVRVQAANVEMGEGAAYMILAFNDKEVYRSSRSFVELKVLSLLSLLGFPGTKVQILTQEVEQIGNVGLGSHVLTGARVEASYTSSLRPHTLVA
jgi:hypothetical protein